MSDTSAASERGEMELLANQGAEKDENKENLLVVKVRLVQSSLGNNEAVVCLDEEDRIAMEQERKLHVEPEPRAEAVEVEEEMSIQEETHEVSIKELLMNLPKLTLRQKMESYLNSFTGCGEPNDEEEHLQG